MRGRNVRLAILASREVSNLRPLSKVDDSKEEQQDPNINRLHSYHACSDSPKRRHPRPSGRAGLFGLPGHVRQSIRSTMLHP